MAVIYTPWTYEGTNNFFRLLTRFLYNLDQGLNEAKKILPPNMEIRDLAIKFDALYSGLEFDE
jgi:hypothetical protein